MRRGRAGRVGFVDDAEDDRRGALGLDRAPSTVASPEPDLCRRHERQRGRGAETGVELGPRRDQDDRDDRGVAARTLFATKPAGTSTEVEKVNGPGSALPFAAVSVTVYDWMITLSSAVVEVIPGFLRLFRSVAQARVDVPESMFELTVPALPVPLVEMPSTVRKVNALPLWPEPELPSQPVRAAATASAKPGRRARASHRHVQETSAASVQLMAAVPLRVVGGWSGACAGLAPGRDAAPAHTRRRPGPRSGRRSRGG